MVTVAQFNKSPKVVGLEFPFKGIHEASALVEQPVGTSPMARNVRGYDSLARRDRGGQRPGLVIDTPANEGTPIDGLCQTKVSLPSQPTGLSPVLLDRQWVPLQNTPVTVNTTSGAKLINGVNDIAILIQVTLKFTNVNDSVNIQLSPATNPDGFQVDIQFTPTSNGRGGFDTWLGVTMAGTSSPEFYSIGLGYDSPTNPPLIGRDVTVYLHIRQGGISASMIAPVGSNGFAGMDIATFTAPYDWVANAPQNIQLSSGFQLPTGSCSIIVQQTQHSPGAFPLTFPFLSNADGPYLQPAGSRAVNYYLQQSHSMGLVPITPPSLSGFTPMIATENFTLGSVWQITVAGTIAPTPGGASTHGDLFFNVAENDPTKTIQYGGSGQAAGFNMQRQSSGAWKLGYFTNSTSGTFTLPTTFKTGNFTIIIKADGAGNIDVTFNGTSQGFFIGGASIPTGSCNFSFANTTQFRRWTNATILSTGPSYAVVSEKILIAQGGNLYIGDTDENDFVQVDTTPIGSGPAYVALNEMSIAAVDGYFYIVDGTDNVTRVKVDTGVIESVSGIETGGTVPKKARLLVLYRDRLIFMRFVDDPFNYFASKSGDALNYDAGDNTPVGAFAGNDTQFAGELGDNITAAAAYGDQMMVMGLSNGIAIMRADPKSGGSIDFVSRETGVAGPMAWARDPDGTFYFMSHDGLYRLDGAKCDPMSRGRLDETLGEIDFSQTKVVMNWDAREVGLKIYLLPTTAAGQSIAVYWEQRKNAFWIDTYPANVGPTCATELTGTGGVNRRVVLGGWDGNLRAVDPAADDDTGAVIASVVQFTPTQIYGPMMEAKVTEMRFVWGAGGVGGFNATYGLRMGEDAVTAAQAPLTALRTVTVSGYQSLDRTRSRGGCAILEISNNVLGVRWQIESADFTVARSGRLRT